MSKAAKKIEAESVTFRAVFDEAIAEVCVDFENGTVDVFAEEETEGEDVIEQVFNVGQTTVVQDAWARGQPLAIHGWVYSLFDGRVRELGMDVAAQDELQPSYQRALAGVPPKGKRDE